MGRFKAMAKRVFKVVGIVLLVIAAAFLVFLLYLTFTEFRPDDVEAVEIVGAGDREIAIEEQITVLTWNIGYGGLGKHQDFFMDGGGMVRPEEKRDVEQNLAGITEALQHMPADVYFIQEADVDSKRSYRIDEVQLLSGALGGASTFAHNYKCSYVPYPLPTIGKVESGLQTVTNLAGTFGAQRVSLPVPFKWPVSLANLKRCLLVQRVPMQGTDKELVLVNLHLEAYDDGEGKAAQTKVLMDFLAGEYEKGNYVIAGGDFNQQFPGTNFPAVNVEDWVPGELEASMLPEGWSFAADVNTPSCRLLDKPFSGSYADTQLYVIDGFILSPNVALEDVQGKEMQFEYADHQPVELTVTLLA